MTHIFDAYPDPTDAVAGGGSPDPAPVMPLSSVHRPYTPPDEVDRLESMRAEAIDVLLKAHAKADVTWTRSGINDLSDLIEQALDELGADVPND